MRRDEFWQGIGAFPAFAHVIIIESLDLPNPEQTIFPFLDPMMRGGRAGSRSEQYQGFHYRLRKTDARSAVAATERAANNRLVTSRSQACRLGFQRKICERLRRATECNRVTPDGS